LTNQILKVQEELKDLEKLEKEILLKEEQYIKAKDLLSKIEQKYNETESALYADLEAARAETASLYHEHQRVLKLDGKCTVCYQPIQDDYRIEKLGEIKDRLTDAESVSESLRKQWTDLSTNNAATLKVLRADVNRYKDLITEDKTKIASKKALENNKSILESQQRKISDEVWELQKQENPFQSLIDSLIKTNTSIVVEYSKAAAELKTLEKQKEQYEFWVDAFSAKGIRSYVLKQITPILNDRAKYYSDLLTSGEMEITFYTERELANGNTKEEFNIEVKQKHGGETYTASSNGEKSRADLVIAFTLGDLAALRSNKMIHFRFLDEPFEHIDATGIDSVIKQ
jgi:DNA repair exonuclease SbcCD ATPase subunit